MIASITRFVGIENSPPGFYIDEAAISAQILCVQQSGSDLQGQNRPLFTPVLGGGYLTPTYLYPATLWVTMFGGSIKSFRSLIAFFSFLFLVGTFIFSKRLWRNSEAAWLTTLAAAISPWIFQFARIAWDPGVALAYLAWGFAALLGKRKWELAAAGVLFSFAAYSYPPLRVQLAIVLPIAIAFLIWRSSNWKQFITTVAAAVITSLPLIKLTLSGEIQGRFSMLSVFNSHYLVSNYGTSDFLYGVWALFKNLQLLLSPSYLFFTGDSNLRHSTGAFGIWSWLDLFAVILAIILLIRLVTRRHFLSKNIIFIVFIVVLGYFAGILPAAMTWESNPHALRSIGASFFLAIGTGGVLGSVWQFYQILRPIILMIAISYFVLFQYHYFFKYSQNALNWFDSSVRMAAESLARDGKINELKTHLNQNGIDYDPMAIRYYEIYYGAFKCTDKL